jgi:uncharacterized protein with HEPN domain
MRNDATSLDFITECVEAIDRYLATAGETPVREVLRVDGLVRDGVVRRLEVLCDATGKLTPELRARYPSIPWARITDFRNVLAHAYPDVDPDRVADVVLGSLPDLRLAIDAERGR